MSKEAIKEQRVKQAAERETTFQRKLDSLLCNMAIEAWFDELILHSSASHAQAR